MRDRLQAIKFWELDGMHPRFVDDWEWLKEQAERVAVLEGAIQEHQIVIILNRPRDDGKFPVYSAGDLVEAIPETPDDRIDRIDGGIDDLALSNVQYVRLERLDTDHIWLQLDDLRIYLQAETPITIRDMED